jgi:hypothetical protein
MNDSVSDQSDNVKRYLILSGRLNPDFCYDFFLLPGLNILMHSNFHRYIKLFRKIRFLYKSLITNVFSFASQNKFYARSCQDRREYSYTAYIPERRSGKDRRKSKNGRCDF